MSDNAKHGNHSIHIVPVPIYLAVFAALIILTWVTAYVSTIDLGRWNIFVALAIAIFKASLFSWVVSAGSLSKRPSIDLISNSPGLGKVSAP